MEEAESSSSIKFGGNFTYGEELTGMQETK